MVNQQCAKISFEFWGLIGLLVSLLLYLSFFRPHAIKDTGHTPTCAMNIEAIESAKAMWKLTSQKTDHDVATASDLARFLKNGVLPACPQGGTYTINANNVRTTCSLHTPP